MKNMVVENMVVENITRCRRFIQWKKNKHALTLWIIYFAIAYSTIPIFALEFSPYLLTLRRALEKDHAGLNALAQRLEAKKASRRWQTGYISSAPRLEMGHENIPLSAFPRADRDSMSMTRIGVSQQIASPGMRQARDLIARAEVEVAKQNFSALREGAMRDLELSYHQALFALYSLQIAKKNLVSLRRIETIASAGLSVNIGNNIDILRLRSAGSELENEIHILETEVVVNFSKIKRLTKITLDYTFMDRLASNWGESDTSEYELAFAKPETVTFDKHPLVMAATGMAAAQRALWEKEKNELFPGLTVSVNYIIRQETIGGMSQGEDMVSLMASVPIPVTYASVEKNKIAEAKSYHLATQDELSDLIRAFEEQYSGEYSKYLQLKKVTRNYRLQILPSLDQIYKVRISLYSTTGGNLAEVYQAYQQRLDGELDSARTLLELRHSQVALQYLLAKDDRD